MELSGQTSGRVHMDEKRVKEERRARTAKARGVRTWRFDVLDYWPLLPPFPYFPSASSAWLRSRSVSLSPPDGVDAPEATDDARSRRRTRGNG